MLFRFVKFARGEGFNPATGKPVRTAVTLPPGDPSFDLIEVRDFEDANDAVALVAKRLNMSIESLAHTTDTFNGQVTLKIRRASDANGGFATW